MAGAIAQHAQAQLATAVARHDARAAAAAVAAPRALVSLSPSAGVEEDSDTGTVLSALPEALQQLVKRHTDAHGWGALRAAFCARQLDAWAAAALAACSTPWRPPPTPSPPPKQQQQSGGGDDAGAAFRRAVEGTLLATPPAAALRALVGCALEERGGA